MSFLLVLAFLAFCFKFVDADWFTYLAALLPGTRDKIRSTFKDQVVWVVGASSGIGEELAVQFAAAGARVIVSSRREDELNKVAARCRRSGGQHATVLAMDILDMKSHDALVKKAMEKFGRLDCVVLNAGRSQRSTAAETLLSVTEDMIKLNTIAPISLAKQVLPFFQQQRSGRFILTSSLAGKVPGPLITSYNATKFAVGAYFDALRTEVAKDGIEINIACPGPVATPITENAFGAKGEVMGAANAGEKKETKMPVERCAYLMLSQAAYGIYESWISQHPVLFVSYVYQYCPVLGRYLMQFLGPRRVQAFKSGGDSYSLKDLLFGKSKAN